MAKKKGLFESFSDAAGKAVRAYFARDFADRIESPPQGVGRTGARKGVVVPYAHDVASATVADLVSISDELLRRYADYEEMDQYPEISVALDIYADEATTPSLETGTSIWAESNDQEIRKELNHLLHRVLDIEDEVWSLTRTMCKYGNNYAEVIVSDSGVSGLQFLPPATVRRVEDNRGTLLGFIQTRSVSSNFSVKDFYERMQARVEGKPVSGEPVFEDWEIVHWRIRGKDQNSVYGSSVIDAARWVWKRLSLLEDALLLYKLQRAPARYAFYVDVGSLDNQRGLAYVNRVKNMMKRKPFFNPRTGTLDMRYNPLALDEDFYIPVRDGKRSTEIEVLSGPDYSETDTLEYHRDKLVSAVKVPKAYMGYGGEATRGPLTSESIQFARTVMRVQASVRAGFRKVFRIHLAAIGKDPAAYDFDAVMNVPSQIMDLARMEVLNASADLARTMGEMLPMKWVFERVFGFTSEEAQRMLDAKEEEKKKQGGGGGGFGGFESSGAAGHVLNEWDELWKRVSESIEKENRKNFDELDRKFAEVMKNNRELAKRVKGVESLLSDIRSSMR